jgi:hypothetical protein
MDMEPREKAVKLLRAFRKANGHVLLSIDDRRCALLAVEAIKEECKLLSTAGMYNRLDYWQQVTAEIEKF